MEAVDDGNPPPFTTSQWISVSPYPYPSPRRLSSHFTPPTRPVKAVKHLAWVSLQGRIVGAEEATSSKTIGGCLSAKETVAWELFTPIQRVLIVAVIAVAAANSKKNKLICQLKKSVEIRDQVLSEMQKKLDNLCNQVNYFNDRPDISSYSFEFSDCGCQHCDHHQLVSEHNEDISAAKSVNEDEMYKFKIANNVEQEERRMSDLSDWAPSVNSSTSIQWNTPIEQDIGKLQKECEEKDATIKELSAFLNSTESHRSERITELEDIIRRKNMLITKLRKDMMVLEQKVIHLTRFRRPSTSKSNSASKKLPLLTDNLIYDMDSTTSPSDDSDSSAKKKHRFPLLNNVHKEKRHDAIMQKQKPTFLNTVDLAAKSSEPQPLQSVIPLKEKSLNQQVPAVDRSKSKSKSKSRELRSGSGNDKIKNGISSHSAKSRVPAAHKRWS
ncbi:uncharacterized protein [Rutidosis leptorrhynchoides]|uniref:uncharacterized protein n=1 Tax=Rutidosis leptorrhynchoides TaxID=125765 RepID=UPI003A98F30A